jgi:arylsulfatase A-like enzyme/Flp pilus assembly protein TadD
VLRALGPLLAILVAFGCHRDERPASVLLVTLDTTRADRLGCYGHAAALTPHLDGLAASGVRFDAAYSPSPMTLPAHATLLTGLEPPSHGVRLNGRHRLPDGVPTIAEALRAKGYRTGAFVAAYVLDRRFGLDRGFEVYDDDLRDARPQAVAEKLSVYRGADRVADAARAWLEPIARAGTPFFAWVHFYDPHYPDHVNPSLAGTKFAGVASYDGEVAFMDQQLGRLLDLLDATGRAGDTLVVAVADHGEGLGDHGEHEHGYLLNEEILRVPLVVRSPGRARPGAVVPAVVALADVAPTILDAVGVTAARPLDGRSLRTALEGGALASRPAYSETDLPFTVFGWSPMRSLVTEQAHYVRTARPELYLRAGDRAERTNVAPAQPDVVRSLDGELAAIEARFTPTPSARASVDDDTRTRLAALGYVDTTASPPALAGTLRDVKDMLAVKRRSAEISGGLATGRLDRPTAIALTRQLVRDSPESAAFQSRLGTLLLEADDAAGAVASLAEAVRLRPDDADTRTNYGQALLRSGRRPEAIEQFRAALALEPGHGAAHLGLGMALAAGGDLAGGVVELEAAVRASPSSADARLNLGNLYLRQGKTAEAEASYREALKLAPDHGLAHHNLATLLARGDAIDEAMMHARDAVRLAPKLAAAHHLLGRLLVEDGDVPAAITEYRVATELDATTPEFFDDLAAAYASNGQITLAITTGRQAMAKARHAGRDDLAREIRQRIAYYRTQPRRPRTAARTEAESRIPPP